jgi:hypothetical protein
MMIGIAIIITFGTARNGIGADMTMAGGLATAIDGMARSGILLAMPSTIMARTIPTIMVLTIRLLAS